MTTAARDNYGFIVDGTKDTEAKGKVGEQMQASPVKVPRRRFSCCEVCLLVVGSLCLGLGVAMLAGGYQAMFDAILKSKLQLKPGSTSYDMWIVTPIPIYLRFYFFNLTNPEEFENGAVPILQEVGPYVYTEYRAKKNISFNGDSTVTFFQQRWWTWDEEASGNNTQDDLITILNPVPVSAAWSVRGDSTLLGALGWFFFINGERLTRTVPFREVSFEGFTDPVLDFVQGILPNSSLSSGSSLPPELPDPQSILDLLPPGLTDYDKFAWFYKRNLSLTYDGKFTMHTGEDSLDLLGMIDEWNDVEATDYFDPPCNEVRGSAGELWPPGRQKDQIGLFGSDLCMSTVFPFKEEIEDEHGLPGYRYWGNNETFPKNECCVEGACAPQGLLNAESCRMGAPAFISFPHFLHADPDLLDTVESLSPEEGKHSFTLDLIPEIGVPMHVNARMQINLLVTPFQEVGLLRDVKEVYLPVLWFEEEAALSPDLAGQLKFLLFVMNSALTTVVWSVLLAGGALVILAVLFCNSRKRAKGRKGAAD